MDTPSSYAENLPRVAKLGFAAAMTHCAECRDYHATWTYRRMLGVVGGIDAERPQLMPLLREISSDNSIRRWLIPGAADSGILATIAASILAPDEAKFIVVDRCPSPLEVCRDYADSRSLALKTHAIDLAALALDTPIDAILAHSVTSFIPSPEQQGIFERLRAHLRPKGHFILCTRYQSQRTDEDSATHETRILSAFRAALAAGQIDLPESESDFEERLCRDARSLTGRRNLPESPESLAAVLGAAGFTVERIIRAELAGGAARQTSPQDRSRSIIYARC